MKLTVQCAAMVVIGDLTMMTKHRAPLLVLKLRMESRDIMEFIFPVVRGESFKCRWTGLGELL
jgi:hypothetical protein